jgi:hypothetical protein
MGRNQLKETIAREIIASFQSSWYHSIHVEAVTAESVYCSQSYLTLSGVLLDVTHVLESLNKCACSKVALRSRDP